MQDESISRAMNLALRYLGIRARSEVEMLQYLKRKECEDEVIATVMERLRDYGYMNDNSFAQGVVNLQSKYRRKGSYVVEQKLYQAGINKDDVQEAMGEIDEERELENAKYWVRKLAPSMKEDEMQKRRQKMYRRLSSKGFSYEVIREACRNWEEQEESFDEFDD